MKTLRIVGDNFIGVWIYERLACRGIIFKDGKILLSYEKKNDTWMLPGGGLEEGEDEISCCRREVAEETGCLIEPEDCVLQIDEYYDDFYYQSRYYTGRIIGSTERKLTDREKEAEMEPRWVDLDEAIRIFERHQDYAEKSEMKRGLYYREYMALTEIFNKG